MRALDPRLKNVLWMGIEKGISFIGVFIITAAMAKYIGPGYYGVISYAASVFSLIYIISAMGADPIIIKKGSTNISAGKTRSVYITVIRSAIYLIFSLLFIFYMFFFNKISDFVTLVLVVSVFLSQLILSCDYISIVNNYTLNSKVNTISNVAGLVIALLIRYILVYYKGPIYLFSVPIVISPLISFVMKVMLFKHKVELIKTKRFLTCKHILLTVKVLLPFAVSSVAANIYNRMPLILITSMMGFTYSGVYSCALTLSTAWSFFPNSLISSFIPRFYKSKNESYLSKVIFLVFSLCAIISFFIYIISPFIVDGLFGREYSFAVRLIPFILISTTLSMMGNALYHYFILSKGYSFIMKKTVICALLSVVFGMFLIKYYGLYGAVTSLVLIEFISLIIINFFYQKGRPLRILLNSFTFKSILSLKTI